MKKKEMPIKKRVVKIKKIEPKKVPPKKPFYIQTYDRIKDIPESLKDRAIYFPDNDIIDEQEVYIASFANLLRKYKNNPKAIEFIADMME